MDKLNAFTKQLSATWKRISFNQRVSIVLVAVVAFVGLWMFARLSHRPSMGLLYPQALDQVDAARIKEKLRDENIRYELRDNGRRIYVPAHLVNEVRLTMAGEGLPADSGGTGWADIFKGRGLGGSRRRCSTSTSFGRCRGSFRGRFPRSRACGARACTW